ncbi:G2/mitotic-specific cyclin-B-like [Diadema setosum]|uniref:G2/mitotic-specific cyclin-B-like n=1 Tax=Diadema setosum TaxID=31175 RepID=UPI003B3B9373
MALRTNNANVNLYGGGKLFSVNNENASARLGAKSMAAKPTQRAALGNISNVARTTHAAGKKVVKKDTKPKALVKSKATSSLQSVVNLPVDNRPKDVCRSLSPEPMDAMEVDSAIEAFSQQLVALQVEDIDREDGDNPQLCSEYAKEIYIYMRQLERQFSVPEGYLDRDDTLITGRMRLILVDWLVQVHLRFHLLQETLFLTIQLIDRFLAEHTVSKGKLQLVGVTAMFVASKYEEMYPPEINDFVYITDNAYTKTQIRQMEVIMLKGLNFALGKPLCLHFLRRNSKAAGVDAQKHTLAKYLMELTLPEYDMVKYDPSEIAAAAIYLSMTLLDPDSRWCSKMAHYSMYSEEHLTPIVRKLAKIVCKDDSTSQKYSAVKTKYASNKFMKISTIPELKSSLIKRLAEES